MTTLESSFGQTPAGGQKTSGMAIASFVCGLLCCLPITTIPAILLGIGAIISIRGNPAKKGMGLAVTGLILGLLFTGTQGVIYPVAYKLGMESYRAVDSGPNDAMAAGMGGDIAGFKASFHGAGATATDAEAQAFLDEVADRYGTLGSVQFDDQTQPPSQFGSPIVTFPYVFDFSGGATLKGEAKIVFSDPQRGGFINKLSSITILDPDRGDLTYPAPTESSPAPDPSDTPPTIGPDPGPDPEPDPVPDDDGTTDPATGDDDPPADPGTDEDASSGPDGP